MISNIRKVDFKIEDLIQDWTCPGIWLWSNFRFDTCMSLILHLIYQNTTFCVSFQSRFVPVIISRWTSMHGGVFFLQKNKYVLIFPAVPRYIYGWTRSRPRWSPGYPRWWHGVNPVHHGVGRVLHGVVPVYPAASPTVPGIATVNADTSRVLSRCRPGIYLSLF